VAHTGGSGGHRWLSADGECDCGLVLRHTLLSVLPTATVACGSAVVLGVTDRLAPGGAWSTTAALVVVVLALQPARRITGLLARGRPGRRPAPATALGAELRASRQQAIRAQDAERRRLERNLHDGAQQELVALLVQIEALERAGTSAAAPERGDGVAALRNGLARTCSELRRLAAGQAPAALTRAGLGAALEAVAVPARCTGVAVEVDCRTERLPAVVEAAVYFCCREAVQNAVGHAGARRVLVTVRVEVAEVVFAVVDDGIGFDPGTAAGGAGLRNLHERSAAAGGKVRLRSSPGAGTQVLCRLPLHGPAPPARFEAAR
jgi:signal transduction histidine kinase